MPGFTPNRSAIVRTPSVRSGADLWWLMQAKRLALSRDAAVYELIEPVLQIAPSGHVEHV